MDNNAAWHDGICVAHDIFGCDMCRGNSGHPWKYALEETVRIQEEKLQLAIKQRDALAAQLYRYEHWTPDHTIEEWCDELKKKLARERSEMATVRTVAARNNGRI